MSAADSQAQAPALSPDAQRVARPALVFSFFNALNWQIALGTPMVLLVEGLGGDAFQVGLCFAFVYLMTPIQVLSTSLLPRYGFKRMMLSGWGLRALFLLPCIALAYLGRDGHMAPWMRAAMIGSVFGFTFCRSLGSSAWLPWLYKLLPERERGRYFASEQMISSIAGVAVLVLCAILFKTLPRFEAFMVEYAVAFVGAGLSYLALQRMADTEKPAAISLREVVRATPGIFFRPSRYRAFLWAACWFGFATTAIPPFCIYFLRVEAHISPGDVVLFTTMQYTGVMLMSWLVRGELDRRGPRPFFFAATMVYAAVATFWLALLVFRFDASGYLPFVFLAIGLGYTLWAATYPSHLPSIVPEDNRPLVLAIYSASTAFCSGLGSVLWGLVLKTSGETPGMDLGWFLVFFGFVFGSMGVLVLLLRRFEYPAGLREPLQLGSVLQQPQRAFGFFINLVDTSLAREDGERR